MPAGIYADTRGSEPKGRYAGPIKFFTMVGEYFLFSIRVVWLGIRHPIRLGEMSEYFYFLGYKSLSIVLFCGFFTGLSQTLFLDQELKDYGAVDTVGRVLAVTSIRELGPLVVALMIIGKVGAAIAAELGSMKVNSQVDAIVGLGQDPERKLATPRVWALTLIMFPLTVLTNVAVLIGGWVITGVETGMYWFQAQMGLYMRHLTSSMIKPFVFGWMIATLSCYFGLKTVGGVRGVGQAVSKTVVTCSIVLFVLNAVLGALLIAFHGGF